MVGSVPENTILVTADVVCLYPNITNQVVLKALKEALEKRDNKKIPREDLLRMEEFALLLIAELYLSIGYAL